MILWVSVGQEPDVRELLASLLEQTNERKLSPEFSDKEALAEVKKAAKGVKALCVLDDVVSDCKYHPGPDILHTSLTSHPNCSGTPSSSER